VATLFEKTFPTKVTFGADPEVYIRRQQDNKLLGAWEITKGTKEHHDKDVDSKSIVDLHSDGVALEFNIKPGNAKQFRDNVKHAMSLISVIAKKHGTTIHLGPEVEGYDKETLRHPIALVVGCDPWFDAYAKDTHNPVIGKFNPVMTQKRYFGGHLHIGYDQSLLPPHALVRLLEASTYLSNVRIDAQKSRREFYGNAGQFRYKPYGLEYRTPSNWWLKDSIFLDQWTNNVVAILDYAGQQAAKKKLHKWYESQDWKQVKHAIDAADENLCEKYSQEMNTDFRNSLGVNVLTRKMYES
jgi:hypothetical protein